MLIRAIRGEKFLLFVVIKIILALLTMKITIITATYNSEQHLRDCLQSAAEQSYSDIEHIVVDGGSTDRTVEIVRSFPSVTRLISEPDNGIYDALNKGIAVATGDVIGFVHSDDMLASNEIISSIANSFSPSMGEMSEGQRGPLNELIDGVYGNLDFVDRDDPEKVVRKWTSKPYHRKNILYGWAPPHPALFLRKEVYKKYAGYNTSFKIAGDYDFMIRIMRDQKIQLKYLPETITKMRTGGISTGGFSDLLLKSKEDIRALRNNGFRFPIWILFSKILRKLPQLFWK